MSNEKIKQTLSELHRDLEQAGNVDPDLRQLLGAVDRDIHALLERESSENGEAADLADRAEEMAADFAAQYPKAEKYLREIAEMLSKLGI